MWFNRDKQQPVEDQSAIEIVAHKKATKRQIYDVKEANRHLKGLLDENHFTLFIALGAAGDKSRKGKKG